MGFITIKNADWRCSKRVFPFPELRGTTTFKGLPDLLADVLPDKYGNSLINAWLSRNGRPTDRMNPVELLCFIGKRGMAALEFEPIVPKTNNGASTIELDNLINIAQEILSGKQDFNTKLSGDEAKALSDILPPFLVLSADIVQLPYQQHFGTVQLFTFLKIILSAGETPGLKVCERYESFHAGAGVLIKIFRLFLRQINYRILLSLEN